MSELYSSDKPINQNKEDKFQRYQFAKRIAQTIINRNDDSSIVLGLYGAWGEGKSSVLNFIQEELKEDKKTLILNFNPWRYENEETLLKNFLIKVSKLFDKELNSNKEKFGSFLSKYGSIGEILGYDISKIGSILSDVHLETLKDRVNEFIKAGLNKLVIIVDDIDRLDKNEIFSLFRLVKLTADFDKTTYILAFDEKMVANAIGERFGNGNEESGNNFLEKIIQVPIKIPQAQPEALQKFCFDLLDKVIAENKISLNENDTQAFAGQFSYNVLPRLKTPRLAIRFSNTLSFSLPLLQGEINIVDLMLIEAVKTFYPHHYEFVKNNPSYFLSSYETSSYSYVREEVEEKKKELYEKLELLSRDFNKIEKKAIKDLLIYLFPRLSEVFYNTFEHEGSKKWTREKRIGSSSYFKRYFSYTVIDGETSDIAFDSFLSSLKNENVTTISIQIKNFIEEIGLTNFLFKIRLYEDELDWESTKKLILSLSQNSNLFNNTVDLMSYGITSETGQVTFHIFNLLKNNKDKDDCFEFTKPLMKIKPYNFAYRLNSWLRSGRDMTEKIFTENEYSLLAKELRLNLLDECGDNPIYTNQDGNLSYILTNWKNENKVEFDEYFNKIFSDAQNICDFLVAYTPTAQSTNHPEPYKSNFTKEHFDSLKSLFDVSDFHKKILQQFSNELKAEKVQFFDFENSQTNINILRQFIHWFETDSNPELQA